MSKDWKDLLGTPTRTSLGLDELIAVLHRSVDMAEESNKLTVPVHRDTCYDVVRMLHELRDNRRQAQLRGDAMDEVRKYYDTTSTADEMTDGRMEYPTVNERVQARAEEIAAAFTDRDWNKIDGPQQEALLQQAAFELDLWLPPYVRLAITMLDNQGGSPWGQQPWHIRSAFIKRAKRAAKAP